MPRQNRRRDAAAPRTSAAQSQRTDRWRDEDYTVRATSGATAGKAYRCPGCDQEIRPGLAHLVVWPAGDVDAADRRHWHRPCWDARDRRMPGVLRARNGPRY